MREYERKGMRNFAAGTRKKEEKKVEGWDSYLVCQNRHVVAYVTVRRYTE